MKPLFSYNSEIFKINSNLAVRELGLLQSFHVIVIERNKMEIIKKKERNHFELEDIETLLRLNEYPKTIKNGKQDPILNRLVKAFQLKMGNSFTSAVVMVKQQRLETIKDLHEGVSQSMHSKATASK